MENYFKKKPIPLPVEEMNPTATAAESEIEASLKPVVQGKLIVGIILFIGRKYLKRHTIAGRNGLYRGFN